MLKDLWDGRMVEAQSGRKTIKAEIATTTKKIDSLIERVIEADSPTLITAYEKQIRKLEERRTELEENSRQPATPRGDFETIVRTAMEFLANP